VNFDLGRELSSWRAMAGLHLDPWQKFVIVNGMAQNGRGKYAAFEVGFNVARQNGKGGILEIIELAGCICSNEPMQIHSAHQFDTSQEAFRRLLTLIEQTPELDRRVKRVSRSHGEEGIELKGGPENPVRRTRTKGGGRGFTGRPCTSTRT
jgi:phage terminase large subunit-like protein